MSERHDNAGFTLVEILIVVGMIGLIMTVLAAVFTIIVRTNPTTEARVDDARSLLGVTTYLPGDISSTPYDALTNPTDDVSVNEWWDHRQTGVNVTPCSGYTESSGVNLLTLSWDQGIDYKVHYRYASNDGSTWRLFRIYCAGSSAARVNRLTAQLAPPDTTGPVWVLPVDVTWKLADLTTPFGVNETVVGAELELTTMNSDQLRFDGASNNPREFLAALPGPGGPGGPSGPGVCTASFQSISPNPAKNQNNPNPNPGQDQDPAALKVAVTVTVTSSGSCGTLGIAYDTTTGTQWRLVDGAGQVLIPASGTEIWTDGSNPLRLKDGQAATTILDTATLVVN